MSVSWWRGSDPGWLKSRQGEPGLCSARSHLTCRGGHKEPLGCSKVSTLSSIPCVLLELVAGKGLWPRSSPSASLSHCHQLFISTDTRPPWQGRLVLLSSQAPPHLSHTATEALPRKDGQPGGRDLVSGLAGLPAPA